MSYEWDAKKARTNHTKHGIDFADAALALEDPLALTRDDPETRTEARHVTLAVDPLGRLLLVAYTWRGSTIRIISARRATPRERKQYEDP